jgi:hypothetical protein
VKSQYGQRATQNGRWMYSATGGNGMLTRRG